MPFRIHTAVQDANNLDNPIAHDVINAVAFVGQSSVLTHDRRMAHRDFALLQGFDGRVQVAKVSIRLMVVPDLTCVKPDSDKVRARQRPFSYLKRHAGQGFALRG